MAHGGHAGGLRAVPVHAGMGAGVWVPAVGASAIRNFHHIPAASAGHAYAAMVPCEGGCGWSTASQTCSSGLVVGGGLALSPVILILLGDDWRGTLRIFAFYYVALAALWMLVGRDRVTDEFAGAQSQPLFPLVRSGTEPPGPVAVRERVCWRHHGFLCFSVLLSDSDAPGIRHFPAGQRLGPGSERRPRGARRSGHRLLRGSEAGGKAASCRSSGL